MVGIATIQWLALCAVTLACAVWFGWELVGRLSTQIDSMVRLGTGILIGLSALGILQTSILQLRRLPLLTLPILALFGVLLRLGMLNRWPSTLWGIWRLKANASWGLRGLSSTSIVIVGTAVFSVSYVAAFPRLLGATIILLGLASYYRDRLTQPARLTIGVVTVALLGLSELARRHEPGWWLAVSNDATFFESLGWSLAQNGPHAHPGLPEGTIFGYHYLAYAVSGTISELSGAPSYYVLNVLLPLLLLTSLALVVFPYLLRHTNSFAVASGLLIVLVSVLRVSSTTSFLFSSWAVAVYLMLLLELHREANSPILSSRHSALLAIVAFVAVFGKATALPIVAALAIISGLAGRPKLFTRRPKDLLQAIPWHITPAGVFFIAYYLPNAPDFSKEGESSVLRVLRALPNNEGAWQTKDDLVRVTVLIGVALLSRTTRRVYMPREVEAARSLLTWIPAVGATLVLIVPNEVQRGYLASHVNFFVVLLMLCITSHLTEFVTSRARNGTLALFLIVIAILGFASYFAVFIAPSMSRGLETSLQDHRSRWVWYAVASFEALLPVVVVFIAIVWHLSNARVTRDSPRAMVVVFSLPLGLALCLSVANSIDHHSSATRNVAAVAAFDASHPDTATSEVGRFIRESTPSDAIVASNSFCCSGTEWLADKSHELQDFSRSYGLSDYVEHSYGGANYQLASVSRRQFLIAGPRFIVMFTGNDSLGTRLKASVLFGATGSSAHAATLRDDGVDYFVLDKAALGDRAVPAFEERTIFENSRYLVLDLAS